MTKIDAIFTFLSERIVSKIASMINYLNNGSPLRAALKIFEIEDENDITEKEVEWVYKCKKKQY